MAKDNVLKLNNAVGLTKAKKKVLRQLLQEKLNVVSEDWKLHAIVDAMCDHYGVDFANLMHGKRVDKKENGGLWDYPKGGFIDRRTKDLSKDFFKSESVLREFVDFLDNIVGCLAGAPATLIVSDYVVSPGAESEDTEQDTLSVLCNSLKAPIEFSATTDESYNALMGLSIDAPSVGYGLEQAHSGFDVLVTRLVCHVAGRYGYTVFCSEIGVSRGEGGEEFFAFGISLVKLQA